MKRLLDIVLALALMPVVCVVMAMVAVLLVARERTTPLFRQKRIGRNECEFSIVKLRTMHLNTVEAGTHEVSASAVTATGQFLRKYKIDELPQVLNVLAGQMSFVGPRPNLPSQTELTAERRVRGVYAARPGITGLGQVQGVDMSQPARLAELDATYIATCDLAMDLRILWQTLTGRGFGDRVTTKRSAK